ncbi:DUF5067 domain-containing protein [Eubacteriales bacterium OttesenSCG-928-A19]|nr:DUF5067 domain-containing protein [Eubacteriales bacterium OttesenSCG-928-A19]
MSIRARIMSSNRKNSDGTHRQDIIAGLQPGDRLYLEDYSSEQYPGTIGVETHEYKLCGFLSSRVADEILAQQTPLADIPVTVDDIQEREDGTLSCIITIAVKATRDMFTQPVAYAAQSPTTIPSPSEKRVKPLYILIPSAAVLLAAIAIVVFVWKPWQPALTPEEQARQAILEAAEDDPVLSYWVDLAVNYTTPPEIISEGSGKVGDYFVVVKAASLKQASNGTQYYEILVDWTNNSPQSTSFGGNLNLIGYQDGVQMDSFYSYEDGLDDEQIHLPRKI